MTKGLITSSNNMMMSDVYTVI